MYFSEEGQKRLLEFLNTPIFDREYLSEMLNELPENEFQSVVLLLDEGFTLEETADILKVSPEQVKTFLDEAQKKLQDTYTRVVHQTIEIEMRRG